MSYALFTHGSVAIVEWGTPALIDLDTLVAELRPVRARGAPVMVIAYVAEGSPAPESEVQREMGRRMGELASLWSSGHVVFEGTGFLLAFKRSVLTGMLFAGKRLSKEKAAYEWRIHASFDDIVQQVPSSRLADLREALKAFTRAPRLASRDEKSRSSAA